MPTVTCSTREAPTGSGTIPQPGIGVCMLTQAFFPRVGGAERQLQALIPRLRERGVDVLVVTRRFAGLPRTDRVNGAPVIRVPIPGNRIVASLSYTLASLLTIARLRRRIQVVHAHELLSPTTTAALAKLVFGRPVVAKVLRGGELGDVTVLRGGLLGWLRLRVFVRLVDVFITISDEIEAELRAVGVRPSQLVRIPNGVDADRFKPADASERDRLRSMLSLDGRSVAIYVGRLEPEKGLDDLLDAWAALRERVPRALLLIVGDGSLRGPLEARGTAGVRFLGGLDDPVPYLRAADCFVLPSHTEGLPNALLEAMATGLPCVATRVGGNVDIIRDGIDGWLVKSGDVDGLVEGIHEALTASHRVAVGRAARDRVTERYSLDHTADLLAALYARLCDRGGPS